jgi:D-3-phosphoglycerate dehydrogenase
MTDKNRIHPMSPRVLISDALSPAAVQIFKDRGIAVDFQPSLGKDKDKLAEAIEQFDGLAIRSATKVTPKVPASTMSIFRRPRQKASS